jgi:5'-nucleotidase / UDP-sugar diphosphatase
VVEIVKNLGGILDAKDGNVFGRTTQFLDGRSVRVRSEETNLGDLCTDAYLWYARQSDPATVIGLKAGGGIRDSIGGYTSAGGHAELGPPVANPRVGKKDGDISQLDIENALRFNDGLTLVTLTAQQLRDCIEWGVSASGSSGRYPHVSGALFSYQPANKPMTYVTDDNGDPVRIDFPGERLQNLVVIEPDERQDLVVENGVLQGDPGRPFRVVTIDYMANGGDGYLPLSQGTERVHLFAANSSKEFNVVGRRQLAVAQYLKAIGVVTQRELPASEDVGNQNLSQRSDAVLAPVVRRIESLPQSTRLTFRTLAGRRYVAESMETLGGAWVRLPQQAEGTGALGELVDSRPPSKERYYRIVMVP